MADSNKLFQLDGKLALITGASQGLGLHMAMALGLAGARVAITARKAVELDQAQGYLQAAGVNVVALQHDLARVASTPVLVDEIDRRCGPIDVLVNNAGATWGGPAATLELANWQKVVDVNLTGTWVLTQAVATRFMIPRKTGSIIIISSVQGLGGIAPGGTPTVVYNTTKAAQINLARSLAAEWGCHNVRVNAILPSWFPTKMTRSTLEHAGDSILARTPLGRLGDPEADIGGPVLFLASEASRYITGHALAVDGGLSAVA